MNDQAVTVTRYEIVLGDFTAEIDAKTLCSISAMERLSPELEKIDEIRRLANVLAEPPVVSLFLA